tara:strand:+ start:11413 stop:11625 length:213 start_codon:yes stop_codon:yes gene_type:complete
MDKIKNMENTTPFADSLNYEPVKIVKSQIDILRDSNRELKLKVIELREELESKKEIINNINNIINNDVKI